MNRSALIEALARSRMSRNTNMTWDDAGEVTKEWMCDVVAPDADVVVAFVAEWLQGHEDNGTLWDIGGVGGSVAQAWREAMGA